LETIGLTLAGRAGARLADKLGMSDGTSVAAARAGRRMQRQLRAQTCFRCDRKEPTEDQVEQTERHIHDHAGWRTWPIAAGHGLRRRLAPHRDGRAAADAEVAEVRFTAFTARRTTEQVTARLIVRRVRWLNPQPVLAGQSELFAVYRDHAIFYLAA
jgi:hypothetical protein